MYNVKHKRPFVTTMRYALLYTRSFQITIPNPYASDPYIPNSEFRSFTTLDALNLCSAKQKIWVFPISTGASRMESPARAIDHFRLSAHIHSLSCEVDLCT